jgi:hypothetical protein
MIQIHNALGISDARDTEIATEVIDILTAEKRVDTGVKKLMAVYDAESLLAGMRLMQAIDLNTKMSDREHNLPRQNATLN